jgi:asparagine synthetase B (glutamine-hydrolysing)
VHEVRVEGPLDPTIAWDGRQLYSAQLPSFAELPDLRGAASWVVEDDEGWLIVRDPLGINKLFWVRDEEGSVVFASLPWRLVDAGYPFAAINAIPPGTAVHLGSESATAASTIPDRWFESATHHEADVDVVGSKIRSTLTGYLEAIAGRLGSRRVYVCLSGGLDSSGIAALASDTFPDVVAVSFDLKRPHAGPSDDRVAAEMVSKELGIPLLEASVTEAELLDRLDAVLIEGIDWRDFNVHAALVNAALADAIAGMSEDAIVLTGDLANEFLVDYEPESIGGQVYYRLPRLAPRALRASLVRGLDTCHREIGIFVARGLTLVQPYAAAVDSYLSLPEGFLGRADRKPALSRSIFGTLVPEHVHKRKKVRAQVGSASGGGVLGLCLDHGIDPGWLRRRFSRLHGIDDIAELDRFVRAGRYRSGLPSLRVA